MWNFLFSAWLSNHSWLSKPILIIINPKLNKLQKKKKKWKGAKEKNLVLLVEIMNNFANCNEQLPEYYRDKPSDLSLTVFNFCINYHWVYYLILFSLYYFYFCECAQIIRSKPCDLPRVFPWKHRGWKGR